MKGKNSKIQSACTLTIAVVLCIAAFILNLTVCSTQQLMQDYKTFINTSAITQSGRIINGVNIVQDGNTLLVSMSDYDRKNKVIKYTIENGQLIQKDIFLAGFLTFLNIENVELCQNILLAYSSKHGDIFAFNYQQAKYLDRNSFPRTAFKKVLYSYAKKSTALLTINETIGFFTSQEFPKFNANNMFNFTQALAAIDIDMSPDSLAVSILDKKQGFKLASTLSFNQITQNGKSLYKHSITKLSAWSVDPSVKKNQFYFYLNEQRIIVSGSLENNEIKNITQNQILMFDNQSQYEILKMKYLPARAGYGNSLVFVSKEIQGDDRNMFFHFYEISTKKSHITKKSFDQAIKGVTFFQKDSSKMAIFTQFQVFYYSIDMCNDNEKQYLNTLFQCIQCTSDCDNCSQSGCGELDPIPQNSTTNIDDNQEESEEKEGQENGDQNSSIISNSTNTNTTAIIDSNTGQQQTVDDRQDQTNQDVKEDGGEGDNGESGEGGNEEQTQDIQQQQQQNSTSQNQITQIEQQVTQFHQVLNNTINNCVTKSVNLIPGGRRVFPIFYALFANFDDLWLYSYHQREYNFVLERLFEMIQNFQNEKWNLIPYQKLWNAIDVDMQSVKIAFQLKGQCTSQKFKQRENNSNGFFPNSMNYLFSNLLFTVIIFLILKLLFWLFFNHKVSIIMRPYSFWPTLILMALDGNIQYFSYLLIFEIMTLFSKSYMYKLLYIWIIGFLFMMIFGLSFLFIYVKKTYGKLSKYFLDNVSTSQKAILYMTVNFGIRNFVVGAAHYVFEQNYQSKIILLTVFQVIFTFFNILFLRTDSSGGVSGKSNTFEKKLSLSYIFSSKIKVFFSGIICSFIRMILNFTLLVSINFSSQASSNWYVVLDLFMLTHMLLIYLYVGSCSVSILNSAVITMKQIYVLMFCVESTQSKFQQQRKMFSVIDAAQFYKNQTEQERLNQKICLQGLHNRINRHTTKRKFYQKFQQYQTRKNIKSTKSLQRIKNKNMYDTEKVYPTQIKQIKNSQHQTFSNNSRKKGNQIKKVFQDDAVEKSSVNSKKITFVIKQERKNKTILKFTKSTTSSSLFRNQ